MVATADIRLVPVTSTGEAAAGPVVGPVMVRFPTADAAERAVRRLLALGNDRIAVAGAPEDAAEGAVLLKVEAPSFFLVQEWCETPATTVYAPAVPAARAELWVEWGMRLIEPHPTRFAANSGPLAVDRVHGLVSWRGVELRDVYGAIAIDGATLPETLARREGPPLRFRVALRLVRRAKPATAELWRVEASAVDVLQAVIDASPAAELRTLELASVRRAQDGAARDVLVVREVLGGGGSPAQALGEPAYARSRVLPEAYVRVEWTLSPELRRDALAEVLGVGPGTIVLVDPAGEGGAKLALMKLPEAAFGPVERLVDHRIDALEVEVREALLGAVFEEGGSAAEGAPDEPALRATAARASDPKGSGGAAKRRGRTGPAPNGPGGPSKGRRRKGTGTTDRKPRAPQTSDSLPAALPAPDAEVPAPEPSNAPLRVAQQDAVERPDEAPVWTAVAEALLAAGQSVEATICAEIGLAACSGGAPPRRARHVLRAALEHPAAVAHAAIGLRILALASTEAPRGRPPPRPAIVALYRELGAIESRLPLHRRWLWWRELAQAHRDDDQLERARTRTLAALGRGLEPSELPLFVGACLADDGPGEGRRRGEEAAGELDAWTARLRDPDHRLAARVALYRALRLAGQSLAQQGGVAPDPDTVRLLESPALRARALTDLAAAAALEDPERAAALFGQAMTALADPALQGTERQERLLGRTLRVTAALPPERAAPFLVAVLSATGALDQVRRAEVLASAVQAFASAGCLPALAAQLRDLLGGLGVRASLHDFCRAFGALAAATPDGPLPPDAVAAARSVLDRRTSELDEPSVHAIVPLLRATGDAALRLGPLPRAGPAAASEIALRCAAVHAQAGAGEIDEAAAGLLEAARRTAGVASGPQRRRALRAVALAAGSLGDRPEGMEVLRGVVAAATEERVSPYHLYEVGDVLAGAAAAAGRLGDRTFALELLDRTRTAVLDLLERSGGEAHYLFRTLSGCLERVEHLGDREAAVVWARELLGAARRTTARVNVLAHPFERLAARARAAIVLSERGSVGEAEGALAESLERLGALPATDRIELAGVLVPALAGLGPDSAAVVLRKLLDLAAGALAEPTTDAGAALELLDQTLEYLVARGPALVRALARFAAEQEWRLRDSIVRGRPPEDTMTP